MDVNVIEERAGNAATVTPDVAVSAAALGFHVALEPRLQGFMAAKSMKSAGNIIEPKAQEIALADAEFVEVGFRNEKHRGIGSRNRGSGRSASQNEFPRGFTRTTTH